MGTKRESYFNYLIPACIHPYYYQGVCACKIRHTAQFSLILFYTFIPDFSHKSLDLVSQLSYNIITERDKEPIIKEETS